MKKWLIPAGIIAVLLIGGYFVVSFYAVKFIQGRLQKVTRPGFTINEIQVKSTYLLAKGIRYEDPHSEQKFFQIEEMRIYPDLASFVTGTLGIRELTLRQPSLYFYRSREGAFVQPWVGMEKGREGSEISKDSEVLKDSEVSRESKISKDSEIPKDSEPKGKEPFHMKIGRIRIEKGTVDFEDRKMGEPPAQIKLRGLDLDLRDIQYPIISTHSPIELKTKMEGKTKEGELYTKGWIDLKTLDTETSFKVREVEVKIFEPYYRKRVSAEIETGHINMDARIVVKKRMIDAPGQLELANLQIKEGGGTVLWVPAKHLISILKDKGNRVKVQFHVKGNIDDPQFSLQETFLNRLAISLAEALGIPIKKVGETLFKGNGKGIEELSEGFKSIEELFKKKREKKK